MRDLPPHILHGFWLDAPAWYDLVEIAGTALSVCKEAAQRGQVLLDASRTAHVPDGPFA